MKRNGSKFKSLNFVPKTQVDTDVYHFLLPPPEPSEQTSAAMGFTALHGLAAKGMTQEIQKLVDNEWVPVRNSPSVQYAGRHKNSTLATAAFLACDRCDRLRSRDSHGSGEVADPVGGG